MELWDFRSDLFCSPWIVLDCPLLALIILRIVRIVLTACFMGKGVTPRRCAMCMHATVVLETGNGWSKKHFIAEKTAADIVRF